MSADPLAVQRTPIPGLLLVSLPLHGDERGWFKENWERTKMTAAGVPDFGPVQQNISYNEQVGTTRGIHAEPWDKWISVATGRVFGAWVDLRDGPSFGTVFTAEIDPSRAVFVPRGVGNAYQTLDPGTAYSYLVNDHWSASAEYVFLNLADETAAIAWPIPLSRAVMSAKDRAHPRLGDVIPVAPRKVLVLGANGQLGIALRRVLGDRRVEYASHEDLDLGADLSSARPWRDYDTVVNAAAFTAVDAAESPQGRATAWRVNAEGAAALARVAADHGLTLVHVSTDYVFDGTFDGEYPEDHALSPLGVYGQTKAAGDIAVAAAPRHYIVRTSWVIGAGRNFLRTMHDLAARGASPSVVDDQRGRLTFADDLARAIAHLLESHAPYGVYNVTGAGEPMTWAEVAREVFSAAGQDPDRVAPVSTEGYSASAGSPTAPRPRNSVLALGRIRGVGFDPPDHRESLAAYLSAELPGWRAAAG
ncbi:dTDP-4-dehydrorhamnose reductase [Microbacterium sp. NPDC056003]|uniref:dTDP-4-dehydrorhamnose reductase n=1 Tax=Microbacterium sp. NPDC056003 TaxID=3345676 RepID=UPI0035D747A3